MDLFLQPTDAGNRKKRLEPDWRMDDSVSAEAAATLAAILRREKRRQSKTKQQNETLSVP